MENRDKWNKQKQIYDSMICWDKSQTVLKLFKAIFDMRNSTVTAQFVCTQGPLYVRLVTWERWCPCITPSLPVSYLLIGEHGNSWQLTLWTVSTKLALYGAHSQTVVKIRNRNFYFLGSTKVLKLWEKNPSISLFIVLIKFTCQFMINWKFILETLLLPVFKKTKEKAVNSVSWALFIEFIFFISSQILEAAQTFFILLLV